MDECFYLARIFDTHVSKTPRSRVALLLDNTSAHRTIEDISFLSNIACQKYYRLFITIRLLVITVLKKYTEKAI